AEREPRRLARGDRAGLAGLRAAHPPAGRARARGRGGLTWGARRARREPAGAWEAAVEGGPERSARAPRSGAERASVELEPGGLAFAHQEAAQGVVIARELLAP